MLDVDVLDLLVDELLLEVLEVLDEVDEVVLDEVVVVDPPFTGIAAHGGISATFFSPPTGSLTSSCNLTWLSPTGGRMPAVFAKSFSAEDEVWPARRDP